MANREKQILHFCTKNAYAYSILLLCIMVVSAYSNTFQSPPALDDFHSYIDEPLVKVESWSVEQTLSLSRTKFGWQRWIPMITFAWDSWLGNGQIYFFHLTNLIIHWLCFIALLFFLSRVLRCALNDPVSKEDACTLGSLALWVAGLWMLHPLQTNAVTYIVQRMSSLVTLFHVLSVAFFISVRLTVREGKEISPRTLLYGFLCLLSMLMAFLSKENSLLIPATLILTEIWFFQPDLTGHFVRFCRKHWFVAAVGVIVVCAFIFAKIPDILSGYRMRHFTLTERLMTQARIIAWYTSALLWPHPDRLSLEHHVQLSRSFIDPPSTLLSVLALVIVVVVAFVYRKRHPVITYGVFWLFLNLAVESTFVPLELIFEHRMYLPSIGLLLSVIALLHHVSNAILSRLKLERQEVFAWCLFFLLCSVLTLATFERNKSWCDIVTLNRDNVSKAYKNPRSHANLAAALVHSGQYEEGIREAQITIELGRGKYNEYSLAVNAIILGYMGLNEDSRAIDEGERLLSETPSEAEASLIPIAHFNLSLAHLRSGNLERSLESLINGLKYSYSCRFHIPGYVERSSFLLQAILEKSKTRKIDLDKDGTIDPGDIPVKTWIARQFYQHVDRSLAKALLKESLAEVPTDLHGRQLLDAMVREDELNSRQENKWSFKEKYLRNPFDRFNVCMGIAFLMRTRELPSLFMQIGEEFLDSALSLQPDSADAHLLKGWYHFERDETEQAVAAAMHALRLDKDCARTWLGLGFFLEKAHRPKEAIVAFEKTLELYPGCPRRSVIMDIISQLRTESPQSSRANKSAEQSGT